MRSVFLSPLLRGDVALAFELARKAKDVVVGKQVGHIPDGEVGFQK